MFDIEG